LEECAVIVTMLAAEDWRLARLAPEK